MGRYIISDDFDHKFCFAVQDSNAASQFGGQADTSQSEYEFTIPYDYNSIKDFNLSHLKTLIKELNLNITEDEVLTLKEPNQLYQHHAHPEEYQQALICDVILGIKIYQTILENGECHFEAEL